MEFYLWQSYMEQMVYGESGTGGLRDNMATFNGTDLENTQSTEDAIPQFQQKNSIEHELT